MRGQIIAAVVIAAATYGVLLRIAEAKVETAVGGGDGFALDDRRGPELAAFQRLRTGLAEIGERSLADRLERLRQDGAIWVAPSLASDRWAVFVEALQLVRRIYVRRAALLDPWAHLYPPESAAVRDANQSAFAQISLAGAFRHELAHYDGTIEEAEAYAAEIAWYESVRASSWFGSLEGERRRVNNWALESAVVNARSAAAKEAR